MKYLRILLIFIGIFCLIKSFYKTPFEQDLPLLLFPEQKGWLNYYSNDQYLSNFIWDDRPLCIQTPFNFYGIKTPPIPNNFALLKIFKDEIIHKVQKLGFKDQKMIKKPEKKWKKLIWPCRRIKPIETKLRFSIEQIPNNTYTFTTSFKGISPGKNSFYSISDKSGRISFIYSKKAWPVIKSFIHKGNIPIGICKIHQD